MQRSSLYDEDILLWSEQQADALRRLRRSRNLPNELDLENVVEEIESVGREQLYAVESRLRLILVHLIKLTSEPQSDALAHWRSEIMNWHGDLVSRFAPSMTGRIDMDKIWMRSLRQALPSIERRENDWPLACPFALSEMLEENLQIDPLVSRLVAGRESAPGDIRD